MPGQMVSKSVVYPSPAPQVGPTKRTTSSRLSRCRALHDDGPPPVSLGVALGGHARRRGLLDD